MSRLKPITLASALTLALLLCYRIAAAQIDPPRQPCDNPTGNLKLYGNFVYGTASCDAGIWKDDGGIVQCRASGEAYSPQIIHNYVMNGGNGAYGWSQFFQEDFHSENCSGDLGTGLATDTTNVGQLLNLGIRYDFQMNTYCTGGANTFHFESFLVPPEPWDPPVCETCVGSSAGACVHPTPRSVVVTSRPDVTLQSPLGNVTVERTYRTSLLGDAQAGDGMFGKGWRANFEYRISAETYDQAVMLFDNAGRKILYVRRTPWTPAVFDSVEGHGGSISRADDGTYTWQDSRGTSYSFNSIGAIESISDIHGNTTSFGYSGGRIVSLTDRHGRVLTFDYQGTTHVKRLLGPPIAANPTGVYAMYAYDGNGNLTGVSLPDGNVLDYGYENPALPSHLTLVSFTGPRGPSYLKRFQYDAQGRIQAVSEGPEGRSQHFAYSVEMVDINPAQPGNPPGGWGYRPLYHTTVTEWTDANGDFQVNDGGETIQHTYTYENYGNADVVTKIEGGGCSCAAEKEYDGHFHLMQRKDNMGVTTRMSYNVLGDLTSTTEAAGTADERITTYEYLYPVSPMFPGQVLQKTTRVPSVGFSGGEKVTTEINDPATGKLQTRREQGYKIDGTPFTYETNYTYTALGALQSTDGPRPGTQDLTTYAYYPAGGPAAGMPWKITEPNGAVTIFQEYDALGNLLRKTDPNGHDTFYAYNNRGLLQSHTTSDGTTGYEYDAQGNITKITYPRGNAVSYSYGQSGLSQVSDPTGSVVYGHVRDNKTSESVYDAASTLTKSTTYEYNADNRLWRTHQASGDFEEFLYDENGNQTYKKLYAASAPSVPFRTTVQSYDSLNRLKTVSVDGDPYHVSYGYDAQGNLSTVTDPLDQVTQYFYDDLGHQARAVSPETGTTEYAYDEAGNVISRKDNLNRVIAYLYDGLNRLTDINYPDATPPVHHRYDDYSAGSYPDAVGRLTEVTDASGFRRFFYGPTGRLNKVIHTIDGRDFTTEYGYDANGNTTSITYPGGRIIQYTYDPLADRVLSVASLKDGVTTTLAQDLSYKPFGPLNGLTYGNGAQLTRDYDNLMYRLGSMAVTGPMGDVVSPRGYDYDSAGNIHGITRDLPGGTEPHVFGFDQMDRLTSWAKPGRSQSFTYDANGNRQTFAENSQVTNYSYDPAAQNRLAGTTGAGNLTYGHDALGNITGWDSKNLAYDINSRLQRVDDAGVTIGEYVYNADGQRAKKTAAGQGTYFEYDLNGRLIHEYRAGEDVSVDYVYLGGEPLAMLVTEADKITTGPTWMRDSASQVTIRWTTNVPMDSRVVYGATSGYGQEIYNPALATEHATVLSGLASQSYHFKAVSQPESGAAIESADQTFVPNQAPVANSQGPITLDQDTFADITLSASDADSDPLTWIIDGPYHGILTGTAPALRYVPAAHYSGDDYFSFRVNDGGADSNSVRVDLSVRAVNHPPALDPISDKTVNENQTLAFIATATDPDGTAPVISASGLPQGASFDGSTFSWKPTYSQAGDYSVVVTASDGQLTDSKTVRITVVDVNRPPLPPIVQAPRNRDRIALLQPVLTIVNSVDPDGDAVTYAFRVFSDSAMTQLVTSTSGIAAGPGGTTSWTVSPALSDGVWYYWKAVVTDQRGATGATVPMSFLVTSTAGWTPMVTSIQPADGSTVPDTAVVSATFSVPMDPTTITTGSFSVSKYVGFRALATGSAHTVALRNDGTVVAWGDNSSGQSRVPSGLSGVVAVAAGYGHSVALKGDGTVIAWGDDSSGQCSVPPGLSGVTAIAAGWLHTVALRGDGTVVTWGDDARGQCDVPPGLGAVKAIAAGLQHTVAVRTDGTVVAWGRNYEGQCDVPAGLSDVAAVGAGYGYTVALKNDGTVAGWGYSFVNFGPYTVPVGLSGVTAVSAGLSYTVALRNDGSLVDWDYDSQGNSGVPEGLGGVVGIAMGWNPAIALKSDGTVVAWGDVASGQGIVPEGITGVSSIAAGYQLAVLVRNDGTIEAWGDQTAPEGLSNIAAVAVGAHHSLALKKDGTVVAWGDNGYGQTAVPVDLSGVVAIAAGAAHSVALRGDGTVVAWGSDIGGQSSVPADLSGVVEIAAGYSHTVALKSDGTVVTWGDNSWGECTVPVGLSGIVAVAAGDMDTIALQKDGTVVAWGYNGYGETSIPADLSGVVAIAAGWFHAVALKGDGTIVAWGRNDNGQSSVPDGLSQVVAIATGYDSTLAVKKDGTVVGWGYHVVYSPLSPLERAVPGTMYYNSSTRTATFTPESPWGVGETYFVTINRGVRSALGIPLAVEVDWSFSVSYPLAIQTLALSDGIAGLGYRQTIVASGGSAPFGWQVISGSLPAGLSLDGSTGTITGTPAGSGVTSFTVRVTDANNNSTSRAFTIAVRNLTVTPSTAANGSMTPSSPQAVRYNQTTQFTVTPNSGYHIGSVSGCGGTLVGSTYTTGLITADCTVTASFVINSYSLATMKAGTGSGTVTSAPAGISCGATCSASYNHGTSVTLSKTPGSDSIFAGWSGSGCSGTGGCTVTMTAAQTVTATFTQGVTVSVPNGGETWARNTTYTIRWAYAGSPGSSVKIELLKGGTLNRTITTSTSVGSGGTGSYAWKVPNNQTVGSNYTIRITSTSSNNFTDTSDANFTIN